MIFEKFLKHCNEIVMSQIKLLEDSELRILRKSHLKISFKSCMNLKRTLQLEMQRKMKKNSKKMLMKSLIISQKTKPMTDNRKCGLTTIKTFQQMIKSQMQIIIDNTLDLQKLILSNLQIMNQKLLKNLIFPLLLMCQNPFYLLLRKLKAVITQKIIQPIAQEIETFFQMKKLFSLSKS